MDRLLYRHLQKEDQSFPKEEINSTLEQALPKMQKKRYFNNLDSFLKKYHFKPTAIPWRYENRSYIINQVVDKDSFGFAIFDITCKRYFDDTAFRGRLPNSKFADEVFMAIVEDYHLNNLDTDYIDDFILRDERLIDALSNQTELRTKHNIIVTVLVKNPVVANEFRYTFTIEKLENNTVSLLQSPDLEGENLAGDHDSYVDALSSALLRAQKYVRN